VFYPGLESHPHHMIAKKQMKHFSGMISFEVAGGNEAGIKLVEVCSLTDVFIAQSLLKAVRLALTMV